MWILPGGQGARRPVIARDRTRDKRVALAWGVVKNTTSYVDGAAHAIAWNALDQLPAEKLRFVRYWLVYAEPREMQYLPMHGLEEGRDYVTPITATEWYRLVGGMNWDQYYGPGMHFMREWWYDNMPRRNAMDAAYHNLTAHLGPVTNWFDEQEGPFGQIEDLPLPEDEDDDLPDEDN